MVADRANGLVKLLHDAAGSLTPDEMQAGYQEWAGEQMALNHWSSALVMDLQRLEDRLAQVRKPPEPPCEPHLPLEEAFWRIDASCEKLFAILTIALGVHALVVKNRGQLEFRPDLDPACSRVRKELKRLARTDPRVKQLWKLWGQLDGAREVRNQVSHSLSAIAFTFVVPFVGIYMDTESRIVTSDHRFIAPKGALVKGEDIKPQTLLDRELKKAETAAVHLWEAAELCAHVIRQYGRLGSGGLVFYIDGRMAFTL